MASVKRNSRKERRKTIFCFFGGCFGLSANHGDHGKLTKYGSNKLGRPVETLPINDHKLATSPIISSKEEIHIVETEEKDIPQLLAPPAHQVIIDKRNKMIGVELKKEKSCVEEGGKGDELESIFGALIIMVTLIVMLIWGMVCAILCAAAWFYLIPRFTLPNSTKYQSIQTNRNDHNHDHLDSWDYKKKVVLQGLLERHKSA